MVNLWDLHGFPVAPWSTGAAAAPGIPICGLVTGPAPVSSDRGGGRFAGGNTILMGFYGDLMGFYGI